MSEQLSAFGHCPSPLYSEAQIPADRHVNDFPRGVPSFRLTRVISWKVTISQLRLERAAGRREAGMTDGPELLLGPLKDHYFLRMKCLLCRTTDKGPHIKSISDPNSFFLFTCRNWLFALLFSTAEEQGREIQINAGAGATLGRTESQRAKTIFEVSRPPPPCLSCCPPLQYQSPRKTTRRRRRRTTARRRTVNLKCPLFWWTEN